MKFSFLQKWAGGGSRRAFRRGWLAGLMLFAVTSVKAADANYTAWVRPWAERPTLSTNLNNAPLKVIVTTVRGEVPLTTVTNMTPLERLEYSYRIRVFTTEVAATGDSRSAFISNTDTQFAPVRRLSADELRRLDSLLAQLPPDNGQLPPPGRRIIVQTLESGQWRVRVYDGAAAPANVKAILALLNNPFDA